MSSDTVTEAAPTATETDETTVAAPTRTSLMRRIIMVVLILGGLACLWYWWSNRTKSESMEGGREGEDKPATIMGTLTAVMGGILGFNRSGEPIMRPDSQKALKAAAPVPPQDMDAMAKLVARAKKAGLKLQGVSQCKWTQYQREMFGDHNDAGRKELESIYTECRSSEMCPNIKGYPTWVHGDRQYPGYKSPAALAALVAEVEQQQPIPSLQGPSEPIVENNPDAVHALKSGTQPMDPDMMYEMIKRMVSKKEADDAAKNEASKEQSADTTTVEAPSTTPTTNAATPTPAPEGGFAPGEPGGAAPGIKENVRGVSFHAPLNVPNLPGTAPFHMDISHADNQNRQGNVPRVANDSSKSTPELARQLIETFNQAETHEATRTPDGQVLSKARYPHSVDITTGDAFDDKTFHQPKNL